MNRFLVWLAAAALLNLVEPTSAWAEGWSGSLRLDKRFGISDWADGTDFSTPQLGMYHRAELQYEKWLGDSLQTVVSGQVRFYDYTTTSSVDGMAQPEGQMAYDFLPWELYFKAYGLFTEGLDLSMGKQRIAWGKADKLNPTDRLNPHDYSDIFDFGAHVPSWSALISYTFPNDFNLSAVWLPTTQPALLYKPLDLSVLLLDPSTLQTELERQLPERYPLVNGLLGDPLPRFVMSSTTTNFAAPRYDLEHSAVAARFTWSMLDMDYSISYYHGYEDLPVPTRIVLQPDTQALATLNSSSGEPQVVSTSIAVNGRYMKTQVVGLDVAGELAGIGLWGEVAVVFPEGLETEIFVDAGALGALAGIDPEVAAYTRSAVSSDPYVQATVGLDYSFGAGIYLNLQWARGMSYEIGANNQNDYFVLKLDQKLFRETLRLSLQGAWMIGEWSYIPNHYSYLANPEVGYKPFDNLELAVGAYVLGGEGPGFFSLLDRHDQLYLRADVKF